MKLVEVTPENAVEETFFCIKGTKRQGFKDKANWFEKRHRDAERLSNLSIHYLAKSIVFNSQVGKIPNLMLNL